jgi:hypothetical protein
MHHIFNNIERLLQSYFLFRHVSLAATTNIRGSSPYKLKHRSYKTLCALLGTLSEIHFILALNIELGKH